MRQKSHTIFKLFSKILFVEQECSNWGCVCGGGGSCNWQLLNVEQENVIEKHKDTS